MGWRWRCGWKEIPPPLLATRPLDLISLLSVTGMVNLSFIHILNKRSL